MDWFLRPIYMVEEEGDNDFDKGLLTGKVFILGDEAHLPKAMR